MHQKVQSEIINNEGKNIRQRFFCPVCGKHTILWILPTTTIKDLPIKCKLCGQESIINISPEESQ